VQQEHLEARHLELSFYVLRPDRSKLCPDRLGRKLVFVAMSRRHVNGTSSKSQFFVCVWTDNLCVWIALLKSGTTHMLVRTTYLLVRTAHLLVRRSLY